MSAAAVAASAVQVVLLVALAPLVVGVVRQTRSRLEGRAGAGVLQPWRDLRKLLSKEPLTAGGSGPLAAAAPVAVIVTALVVAALLPLVAAVDDTPLPDDLLVVVSVLLAGTVALALLGLATGTAFGGMGSSRGMTIAALVEPTVLVAVYALSVPAGGTSLSHLMRERLQAPSGLARPAGLLAVAALALAVIAETGRLPVDNPATHLELTMVHEAMVLESAGRDLALLELGAWLRLTALTGLVVSLLVPWGMAVTASPAALSAGAAALTVKVLGAAALLGAVEVTLAKVRLFRVPELLAGSFLIAFLAVAASVLTA